MKKSAGVRACRKGLDLELEGKDKIKSLQESRVHDGEQERTDS